MKILDKFTFGKYKGQTLKYVLQNHGTYAVWCLKNITNFCIEPKELQEKFLIGYQQWKNKKYDSSPFSSSELGVAEDWENSSTCPW